MRTGFITFVFFVLASLPLKAQVPYRISGTVVNGLNGSPVPDCQVVIRRDDLQANPLAVKPTLATTSSDGQFVFENVAPGKYSLVARSSGYRTQALDEHDGYASAVAVGPGKDSEHIVFRLAPSAAIVGRIVDEFGDPVADAQVMLYKRGTESGRLKTALRATANSDHGGFYHFFRLPPGDYLIAVIAQPWYGRYQRLLSATEEQPAPPKEAGEADLNLTYPITFYPDATESGSASPIRLQAGDRVQADMHLAAQPAAMIRISLPDAETAGPPSRSVGHDIQASVFGAPVNVYPMVNNMNRGTTTVMTGIAPGDYTVKETRSNMTEQGLRPDSQSLRQVKVSADGTTEYKASVEGTPVSGAVELQGAGGPLRGTTIRFEKSNGEAFDMPADPKGALQPINLFPGVYQYSAFSQQGVISSLQATGAKVVGRTIQIARAPVQLKVILANVATTVTGTALDADGKPFHGAMVILVPEDVEHNSNIIRRDQSDMDGTFTLRVVMPGKYRLLALQNAWDLEWSNPKALERFYPAATVLDIPPASKNLDVEVKVQLAQK